MRIRMCGLSQRVVAAVIAAVACIEAQGGGLGIQGAGVSPLQELQEGLKYGWLLQMRDGRPDKQTSPKARKKTEPSTEARGLPALLSKGASGTKTLTVR